MKAQTKALVAAVVVIALALSAVSGITYSWFSDTEESKIDVTTAKVDYDVTYTANAEGLVTVDSSANPTFAVSNLAAAARVTIDADITNDSSIKTVYKVVLSTTYTAPTETAGFTLYDFSNIQVYQNDKTSTTTLLANENKTDGSYNGTFQDIIIRDWTVVESGTNPGKVQVIISTPKSYGSDPSDTSEPPAKIKSYNTSTGVGSTEDAATAGDEYAAWSSSDARSGLSFTVKVIAVQGDYPYTKMSSETIDSVEVSSAVIPSNKIVTAKSIVTSDESNATASDVTIDFSNVSTVDSNKTTKVTGTKVTAKVTNVNTANSTVTVDLNLYKVSGTTSTQIENPVFDEPVVITMTVPGALSNPKVIYKAAGDDGTVLSSTINGSGSDPTTTIVFSVMHFSEYVIQDEGIIETLDELKTAMTTGGSYKLVNDLSDVSEGITVSADSRLDLNGHSITFIDTAGFVYKTTFKVIGTTAGSMITASSGTIFGSSTSSSNLYVNGGTYTATDGVLIYSSGGTPEDAEDDVTGGPVTIEAGKFETGADPLMFTTGTLTINGGSFTAPNTTIYAGGFVLNSDGISYSMVSGGDVTINGGSFTATKAHEDTFTLYVTMCNLTINGGTFYSEYQACIYALQSEVIVNGGEFSTSGYIIDMAYGDKITINGGTFKGVSEGHDVSLLHFGSSDTVTITGGQFSIEAKDKDARMFYIGTNTEISVTGGQFEMTSAEGATGTSTFIVGSGGEIFSGGTFNIDPSDYLAEGYKATENPTGTWTVSANSS